MYWILLGLSVYLILCFILYRIQERFLFHPEKLEENFEFKYQDSDVEELFFGPKEGVSINGLHFKCANSKGLILYFHGNTRSIKGWGKFATDFTQFGWEVMMIDYRGFGKSIGKRSEHGIKNDAQFIYNEITRTFPESKIILYGRSMGTGFAAKLASNNNPLMLILEAPYYSLLDTGKRYLFFIPLSFFMRYTIRTYRWMPYVSCPVVIIHGSNDWLVPWRSGKRLAEIRPDHTRFMLVKGAGHNTLRYFDRYHEILKELLR